MREYLSVGFVLKPHGVRGAIKVEPLTDDVTRFKNMKHVFIEEAGNYIKYDIESRSVTTAYVLLKLKGVDNPDMAEKLRNSYLWIKRTEGRTLGEDEYYWGDIIGCNAVFSDNGKVLGKITDIMHLVSNDVYTVNTGKEEVLIPALKQYISFDVENNTVFINRTGLEEILPDEN